MENLNAEQAKKELSIISDSNRCDSCGGECSQKDCSDPLHIKVYCPIDIASNALALITSQEQRIGAQDMTISELRQRAEKAEHDAERYAQRIKQLTEENERLNKLDCEIEYKKETKKYQINAIKVMRHKLCDGLPEADFWRYGEKRNAIEELIIRVEKEMMEMIENAPDRNI